MLWVACAVSLQVSGTPPGFKPVGETTIFRRAEPDYGAESYMVSLEGDRLRVETRVAWVARESRVKVPRPKVVIDLGMSRARWNPGEGVRVSDGWLQGFDMGEFGGGLYWFAPDGSSYRRVNDKNVAILGKTSKGLFAVRSLSHLKFWYADLVELVPGAHGWKTRVVTDLHESPGPILQAGDRFVYATNRFVTTLETDGTQHEIYHPWSALRPESMVLRSNGEIWIGSTQALLRLTPKADGHYTPQWFVPLTG